VANLLALQPDESIAQVLDIRDYAVADYLVLATREGLVKKTRLDNYDTNRQGGVIAIRLNEDDELVSALLVNAEDDILLISRRGMSVRFEATDEALRPMGRATAGVRGMKFKIDEDCLLSASVAAPGKFVFVVTDGGYAKRTAVEEYRVQGRGGTGIKVAKLNDDRGTLAGGLIVSEDDEVLVVLSSGKVVRSAVAEVPAKGRDTMGVVFARTTEADRILAIARNGERGLAEDEAEADAESEAPQTTETPEDTDA
jgi:DNA gyrase subunit A